MPQRNFKLGAKRLLTTDPNPGSGEEASPASALPATRAAFIQSAEEQVSGESGLFMYSGHVSQQRVQNGPDTCLDLLDGPLSAAEISRVPMPSHVLMAACASNGAAGAGAGEWLGLAGNMLVAGACQVTATSWVIFDTPFTAQFESRLALAICKTADSAYALSNSQLAALEQWREQSASMVDLNYGALPRTWASFLAIGW